MFAEPTAYRILLSDVSPVLKGLSKAPAGAELQPFSIAEVGAEGSAMVFGRKDVVAIDVLERLQVFA